MQTQQKLVAMHKNHSIRNIDVLSFNRLAYRIFDELGGFDSRVLEDTGKSLILRKVAQEKAGELTVLQNNMTKAGYIGEMKSLISELSQYQVTPEQLKEVTDRLKKDSFSGKLHDVLVMYQGFLDDVAGRFVTAEEVLELLKDRAAESAILKDSVIALDGFTGFTPVQNDLLKKLITVAEHVFVTVTIDERENPYHAAGIQELFAMSKKTVRTLTRMAQESRTPVEEPVWIHHGADSRFQNSAALAFLEQNLFRTHAVQYIPGQNNARDDRQSDTQNNVHDDRQSGTQNDARNDRQGKSQDDIRIFGLKDPRAEMHFLACEIVRMVRNQGYRYRDIAIVCGDLPHYANYAEEIFDAYGIPLFIDQKAAVTFHPFIEFLQSVPEVILQDFSQDAVFRYLRSGMAGISPEETDVLENYCLAAGVRGYRQWKERFCYQPSGLSEEDMEQINALREQVASSFESLYPVWKDDRTTVLDKTQAFYAFICARGIAGQLAEKQAWYEAVQDRRKAGEYAQIYRIVMELFDKLVELLGEEAMPLKEYAAILTSGYEEARVGVIPPGYDRVVLGDMERTRLDDIRILFFAGVNDGIIPGNGGADGILSGSEREQLQAIDLELAPTVREKTFIQRFYLYLSLAKPSEKLCITYARVDGEGKALRRSYLIGILQKLFPDLPVTEIESETFERRMMTPENAIDLLIEGFRDREFWEDKKREEDRKLWGALYRYYRSDPSWNRQVDQLFEASEKKSRITPISTAVTKAIYGTILDNSVTRLEAFAACAYAHFLSYGLKLRERQISGFEASDVGSIFHETLKYYALALKKSRYDWFTVPEEESARLLEEALQQAVGESHNPAIYENARNLYAKERMHRILKRTVWALTKQVRQGEFEPDSFEIAFSCAQDMESVRFELSPEEKIQLYGRIDRIDTMKTGDRVYVKVIDYKSGNTSFQLLNIYYGLQLQLVVYMNAAMEIMHRRYPDKEIVPAGIFYYHVKDPMVESEEEMTEEQIREKILSDLKLNGVVNSEKEVLTGMDASLADSGSSAIIPAGFNKNGTPKKNSMTMTTEDFGALSAYVSHTIRQLGTRMMQGDIAMEPYQLGDRSGCDYCSYRSVCRFDPKLPGFSYRRLEEIGMEQLLNRMKGETGSGENMDSGTETGD